MKYALIVLFATLMVACNRKPTASSPIDIRMPADEIVEILKDHLPEEAVTRVESRSKNQDQFDLELTTEQFERLQFAFGNKVEDYARTTYSYDRFSNRSTTFKKGFSSFSFSLGKGNDYHYIITGSLVLVEDRGKVVIWIKPTKG
jgi:hypothetical protein